MKAYITAVNEPTADLCFDQLRRNGFDPILIGGESSLASKLQAIYAFPDQDFIRIDADVIPNRNLTLESVETLHTKQEHLSDDEIWWVQFNTFDWYKQDLTTGGVSFIKKEALPAMRAHIGEFLTADRPESQMFRLDEFHNPRRCVTDMKVMGLHGYGQKDLDRVKEVKRVRRQYDNYDWDLVDRLCRL